MSLHGSASRKKLLTRASSGTTGVIRFYDDDSSSSQHIRCLENSSRSCSDGVLAELGVVGLLLSSLGSACALKLGHFSSEGTGLLCAQVVGSVLCLGKGISGLSSALLADDGKDLSDVLADVTNFGELDLGGGGDLAHTEGSEFFLRMKNVTWIKIC